MGHPPLDVTFHPSKILFIPVFCDKLNVGKNILLGQIYFGTNILWANIFWDEHILGRTYIGMSICWDENIFWDEHRNGGGEVYGG